MRLMDPRGVWSQMDCRVFFENRSEATVEAARIASHSVLSKVQDFVTEFLRTMPPSRVAGRALVYE